MLLPMFLLFAASRCVRWARGGIGSFSGRPLPGATGMLGAMRLFAAGVSLWFLPAIGWAAVVLNEIAYHPPDERDDLQFVELHNATSAAADLSGWKFTAGIQFTFPAGTQLAAGAYLVVGKNPAALAEVYKGVKAIGPFGGTLKHGGERITLGDAAGKTVDSVKYGDHSPWPLSPDGAGPTLERVSATGRSEDPANWAPSTLPERETPTGSPGKVNGRRQAEAPAAIADLSAGLWRKGAPVSVLARVEDGRGIENVTVQWQLVDPVSGPGREQSTPAKRTSGSETSGRFEAVLPAVGEGHFLRYRLLVQSRSGITRTYPDPQDLRTHQTLAAWTNPPVATIPQFFLYQFGVPEAGNVRFNPFGLRGTPLSDPTRGGSLLVVVPTNKGPVEVFDFIRIAARSGGWKVRLGADARWNGAKSLNVIFENRSRWVLSEHLGYELFRRAGVPAPASGHVRVTLDGKPLGYHLWVEQPNRAFLQRHRRDPRGELFKAVWYGQSVADRHEKKTQVRTGHREFLRMIGDLDKLTGDAQWNYINEHFDVAETASYYATCLLIQNWDGYFNNHYLHQSPEAKQKWQIYPWDLDKTWGDFDGATAKHDWYSMPITYGMKGDREPANAAGPPMRGPWGNSAWWRPGGVVSAPVLANPEYRRRMLARLRELLNTEFTAAQFGPVINDLEARLLPEVRHRLELRGNDVAAGERRFKADIESFRRQVQGRGDFLRAELK